MGGTLDEAMAWGLVRAALFPSIGAPPIGEVGPRRVQFPSQSDPHPDAWLDLHASGHWEASPPPTEAARELLDLFIPLTSNPDLVIGQLGQSLDGRIATVSGDSHYITGKADIRRLHRLRALVDAVVVGAGTVAKDNPRLTVRGVKGENPVRVVLDPDGRLSPDRHVFSDGAARTLVLRRALPDPVTAGHAGTPTPGVPIRAEVVSLPVVGPEGFDPADVLNVLRTRGLRRVLIEGGGITVSRFLQAGLLDRLHLTVAPLLIGSGQPALTLSPISTLAEALRPRCRQVHLGEDVLFDLDLR